MIIPKTKVEYGTHHWGFWRGCTGKDCAVKDECWARGMSKRFKKLGNFDKPKFLPKEFYKDFPVKPSRILVCFQSDIFGEGVEGKGLDMALSRIVNYPQHAFIFLTKHPEGYLKYAFPSNCWLGITVNTNKDIDRLKVFADKRLARNLKWVSFEPLMERLDLEKIPENFQWAVMGGWSSGKQNIGKGWIYDLVGLWYAIGFPFWLKNNLKDVWGNKLIQELPE